MPFPIEPRPPQPIYVPSWWEKRWPWLLDWLALLDLDPVWERLAPLWRPFDRAIAFVVLPLANLLDAVAHPVTRLRRTLDRGAGAVLRSLPLPGLAKDYLWLRTVEPNRPLEHDSHAVLKRQYKTVRQLAVIAAVALHASAFAFWPVMEAEDFTLAAESLEAIEIPPEIEIPPPPEAITRPATPVMSVTDIDEDITIAPTTFEENPVSALPPPPEEETPVSRPTDEPFFTPFTVAPSVLNLRDVQRALIANYPPLLRDAGIGGSVVVWFFVNTEGRVERTRVAKSSGHKDLDEAALKVAEVFRFSPALNRDQKAAVWVQIPLDFTVN